VIFVECDPDRYVIKSIVPEKRIKHGGCKSEVLKKVRKRQDSIGIVDEDPEGSQPGEMKNYIRKDARDTVELLSRKSDGRSLIQLSPDIEGWLIRRAKHNGIRLENYNLPDDRRRMHDTPHIEEKPNFQRFVKKLIDVNDDEVNILRKWIRQAIG